MHVQWSTARSHGQSHVASCPRTYIACSRSTGARRAPQRSSRRSVCVRAHLCIDACLRCVVESNAARAYRHEAAAATRAKSQTHRASLPPHRARAARFTCQCCCEKGPSRRAGRKKPPSVARLHPAQKVTISTKKKALLRHRRGQNKTVTHGAGKCRKARWKIHSMHGSPESV